MRITAERRGAGAARPKTAKLLKRGDTGVTGGARMQTNRDEILRAIESKSLREAEYLAGEFARAASEEREHILAALEYEKWLADCCQLARGDGPM